MKVVLSTHNVTLTKAIEEHINDKVSKLEHLDRFVIDARVTLEHDNNNAVERQFKVGVRLTVPGPDLFAEDSQSDLYKAIDLACKKLEQQIRKRQGKYKVRNHAVAAKDKQQRQEEAL